MDVAKHYNLYNGKIENYKAALQYLDRHYLGCISFEEDVCTYWKIF